MDSDARARLPLRLRLHPGTPAFYALLVGLALVVVAIGLVAGPIPAASWSRTVTVAAVSLCAALLVQVITRSLGE